jgi:hypothetical protein
MGHGGLVTDSSRAGLIRPALLLSTGQVPKRIVFDTTPKPSENLGKYAQGSVTKPITKSRLQYLTGSMSFDTIMVTMTIPSQRVPTKAEQKKRLLKAKIAVALHDELGRVPKQEEIEQLPIF